MRYWDTEYDLRRIEARLNALPQFVTEIDDLDIHFIHVKSRRGNALPVILIHGWPGSVVEMLSVVGPLTDPTAYGGLCRGHVRCRDPVDSGLRALRQADDERLGSRPRRQCLGRADEAPRLHALRRARRRLGRGHRRSDGRAGTPGADRHPLEHAGRSPARDRKPVRAGGRSARRRPGSRPKSSAPTSRSATCMRRGSATASRCSCIRRRCTGSRTRPPGWPPGWLDHDAQSYLDITSAFVDGSPRRQPDAR